MKEDSEVKEVKTAEHTIQDLFGINPGSSDLTPMDYGECKRAMQEYASLRTQQLQEENAKLRAALDRIAYPIKHAQIEAEKIGAQLNGMMAIAVSNDPAHLQGIAQNVLQSLPEPPKI